MKVVATTKYECEQCRKQYNTEEAAHDCEALPILDNKGAKVGDFVLITKGEGTGLKAKVTGVYITQPGWGPNRYNHSVYLTADVVDSWGSRQLGFDSYEAIA